MMKRWLLWMSVVLFASMAQAVPPTDPPTMMRELDLGAVQCNWGILTMRAITELDFPVGPHSADPDGDGIGRNDPDRNDPRVGLPHVGEDLEAVCELVGCSLFPEDPICD